MTALGVMIAALGGLLLIGALSDRTLGQVVGQVTDNG